MILAAVAVAAIVLALFVLIRHRRSESLREQFGPEYKRTVDQYGDQRKAEAELAARERRVRKVEIRTLAISGLFRPAAECLTPSPSNWAVAEW